MLPLKVCVWGHQVGHLLPRAQLAGPLAGSLGLFLVSLLFWLPFRILWNSISAVNST